MVMQVRKSVIIILVLVMTVISVVLLLRPVQVVEVNGSVSISPTKVKVLLLNMKQVGIPINVDKRVSCECKNISWITYTLNHGKPRITKSSPQDLGGNVVNLTIKFLLVTPANKTIEFEPLQLGKGGRHDFQLILGPDENITSGKFKLVIKFYLEVRTPAGITIGPIELTPVELEFEVP